MFQMHVTLESLEVLGFIFNHCCPINIFVKDAFFQSLLNTMCLLKNNLGFMNFLNYSKD